ncbi:unnamed protein product, partial [Eretmochelys imbricata]
ETLVLLLKSLPLGYYFNIYGFGSEFESFYPKQAPEESPLLRLVSLQNADVWWNLDPHLAAVLGVSETDARGRIPSEDVTPSIWATVLAMVWLHGRAVGQRDESSCWRPRLWAGCGTEQ